ncbi:biofilm formation regulatory protein BssS [Proteus vulgaris]|nr:biofilm formation regulatory protein BssS [Proteus vulgaris]
MSRKNEVIQTHPVVGWDISTVDIYDAMMLRLHYLPENEHHPENAVVDKTLWLTTDIAKQLIHILQAGIDKIESSEDLVFRQHQALIKRSTKDSERKAGVQCTPVLFYNSIQYFNFIHLPNSYHEK